MPADVRTRTRVRRTPLPWRDGSALLLVILAESIASSMPMPFVAWLVIDFSSPDISANRVGLYAGLVTASYFVGQLVFSPMWGRLSDGSMGRKKVLMFGMGSNVVFSILLGLSPLWPLAMLARLANGSLNSSVPVVKTVIRDITDETNQARAYTLRSCGYGAGVILGPLIGGGLARPAKQFPALFASDGIWVQFPFLLPCLVSAAVSTCALILTCFFLRETRTERQGSMIDIQAPGEETDSSAAPLLWEAVTDADEVMICDPRSSVSVSSVTRDPEDVITEAHNESAGAGFDVEIESVPLVHERRHRSVVNFAKQLQNSCVRLPAMIRVWFRSFSDILDTSQLRGAIVLYGILAFVWLCFDASFAVWALRDVSAGGLAFSAQETGLSLASGGVGMLVFQLFIFVPIERRIGPRRALALMFAGLAPVIALTPVLAQFIVSDARSDIDAKNSTGVSSSDPVALWPTLSVMMALKQGLASSAAAAVNILIANGARYEVVGAVNGFGTVAAAVARVIAPSVGSPLVSILSGFGLWWAFFATLGAMALASSIATVRMSSSIDQRRPAFS